APGTNLSESGECRAIVRMLSSSYSGVLILWFSRPTVLCSRVQLVLVLWSRSCWNSGARLEIRGHWRKMNDRALRI
ncbi:hypothetical protein BGZ91_007259, partial [Linnemannia elongata]